MAKKLPPIHPRRNPAGRISRPAQSRRPTRSRPRCTCRAPGSNASRAKKRPVTADTALRLGKFFKTGGVFWMNIQARYDLETADDMLAPEIKRIVSL